jgi:phosphohistidine swiveling domain-containing protein
MGEEKIGRVKLWDELPGYDLIEELDVPEMHSWFLAATHCVPPWTPLFGWYFIRFCSHGTKTAAAELSIPTCKGWEMRYRDGGLYSSFIIVRDPKEIEARQARFTEALQPWLDNFDGLWDGYKKELLGIYAKLREVDPDHASNRELYHYNYEMMLACRRMWEIHHLGLYSSFSAWFLLESLCKERFGIRDQDSQFQDMLRGFDNKIYEMDKRLWEFGRVAMDMGLGHIFKDYESGEIIKKLQESDKGKDWYKRFMGYLATDEIGGWRMRRMSDFNEPYWLEEPSTPMDVIKTYIMKGTDYELEETRKNLVKKRETAIASLLQKVPQNEKGFFALLIALAGKASSYSEEHDLYCELMAHAHLRRGYLGIGRRLAQTGTIERPDDIFMLNPDEIDRVLMVPEVHDLRSIAGRRRAAWQEWQTRPNPPLVTDRSSFEEAVQKDLLPSKDTIAIKAVVGEIPEQKLELGADIFGICGCVGEAEGKARVLYHYQDLKHAQPGEILVCPAANPAWTPVFGIVGGVVCDSGGTLSHTAIIGREYGVPTVVNTFNATSKIKTGQRIRIDAANGAVFILDK